jgi:hypothetical protein
MKAISLLMMLAACSTKGMRPDPLQDPFEARKEKIRQCYTESESFTKKIPGSMEIWVLIAPDGSVKEAKILKTDFKDPNFSACILGQLKKLTFPIEDKRHFLEIKQPLRFVTGIP